MGHAAEPRDRAGSKVEGTVETGAPTRGLRARIGAGGLVWFTLLASKTVQHVHDLVIPAALLRCLRPDLPDRRPDRGVPRPRSRGAVAYAPGETFFPFPTVFGHAGTDRQLFSASAKGRLTGTLPAEAAPIGPVGQGHRGCAAGAASPGQAPPIPLTGEQLCDVRRPSLV